MEIFKNEKEYYLHWANNKRLSYFEYRVELIKQIVSYNGKFKLQQTGKEANGYVRYKQIDGDGWITQAANYRLPIWYKRANSGISYEELIRELDIKWTKEFSDELTVHMNAFYEDNWTSFNHEYSLSLRDNSDWTEGLYWKNKQHATFYKKRASLSGIIKKEVEEQTLEKEHPMIPIMRYVFGEVKSVDFTQGVKKQHNPLFNDYDKDELYNELKETYFDDPQEKREAEEEIKELLERKISVEEFKTCRGTQSITTPILSSIEKLGWFKKDWCLEKDKYGYFPLLDYEIDDWITWDYTWRKMTNNIIVIKPNEVDLKSFKGCLRAFKWPNEDNKNKFKERIQLLLDNEVDFRVILWDNKYGNQQIEVIIKHTSIATINNKVEAHDDYVAWLPNNSELKYKIYGLSGAKVSYYKAPEKTNEIVIVEGVFDGLVPLKGKSVIFLQNQLTKNKVKLLKNYFYAKGYRNLTYLPDNDDTLNDNMLVVYNNPFLSINHDLLKVIKERNLKDLYDLWESYKK